MNAMNARIARGCLLGLLLSLSVPARAETDVRSDLAAQLLDAMGAQRQAELAIEQLKRSQEAMLKLSRLPPGQEEKSREMQDRVHAVIAEEFSWEKWKNDYAYFYAATFSEQELRDLLAFYRSPAGLTYVAKMPEIHRQAQSLVLGRMAKVTSRTQAIVAEYAPRTAVVRPTAPQPTPSPETPRD